MDTIETVICHHGILGQKWGRRRYQNPDGTLTELGRKRYAKQELKRERKEQKLETKKRKIIVTGDTERLKKYINDFSDRDLQEFQNRKRLLEQVAKNDLEKAKSSGKSFIEGAKTTVDKARSLLDTYNKAAGIINNVTGEETVPEYSLEAQKRKREAAYNKMIDTITPEDILKNWDKIKPSSAEALSKKTKMFETVQSYVDTTNKKKKAEEDKERQNKHENYMSRPPISDLITVNDESYSVGDALATPYDFSAARSKKTYSLSEKEEKKTNEFVSDYLDYTVPTEWGTAQDTSAWIFEKDIQHSNPSKEATFMDTLESVICHHGVKGQKWGVRRYQNQDGSLTELGKKRQAKQEKKEQIKKEKQEWKERKKSYKDMKIFDTVATIEERRKGGRGSAWVKRKRCFDRLVQAGVPPILAYEVALTRNRATASLMGFLTAPD